MVVQEGKMAVSNKHLRIVMHICNELLKSIDKSIYKNEVRRDMEKRRS